MQESNALFHNGFATILETLRILDEVKQDEDLGDMLKIGSLANVLRAESWKKKHMKKKIDALMKIEGVRHNMELAKEEQYHKGYCKAVEDICNSLKVLYSQKAVLKKNE